MLKAFQYRLYPNKAQRQSLQGHFGASRWVYNWGLEQKMKAWQVEKKSLNCFDLIKELPKLKKDPETSWLSEVNAQSLQKSLVNLDVAYQSFFRAKKGFPKFKSKHRTQRVQYPQRVTVDWETGKVNLPKIKKLKAVFDRKFEGSIKTSTVTLTPSGKYFISILVEDGKDVNPTQPFEEDSTLGIDLGLKHFATLSTGEKVENPRFHKAALNKLAHAQRAFDRKQKGSRNRDKQRLRVAKLHERIANQRKDFLHKLSSKLISENQAIALEDLNVTGMVQNHKLARSISDAGWSEFVRQLEYKASWYGKTVFKIGRFEPSSKLCTCGKLNRELKLSDREWTCHECGIIHDRDILAANNIKRMAFHPQREIHKNTVGYTGI